MDERSLEQREAELKRREEELEKKEAEISEREEKVEATEAEQASGGHWLYDKINVPIKYLDIFIGVCAVAIVVFIALGMLKGRGYF